MIEPHQHSFTLIGYTYPATDLYPVPVYRCACGRDGDTMPDALDTCRERWRDAPPLTDEQLDFLYRVLGSEPVPMRYNGPLSVDAPLDRLVAEILRLREENSTLRRLRVW